MATEIPMLQAVERDWNTAAARAKDVPSWDITTDVLIGGYGGAGVCAAIEVAEAGVDVVCAKLPKRAAGAITYKLAAMKQEAQRAPAPEAAAGRRRATLPQARRARLEA